MSNYVARRLLTYLVVLFFISVLSFTIMQMAPGDPIEMMIDPATPQEVVDVKREALGLNAPTYVQYFKWLGNVLQGNLGYSLVSREPVAEMILERIGPTMVLVISSLLVGFLLSVPLGVFSAVHQNSAADHATSGLALLFISAPTFFVALSTVYFFSLRLRWFPTGGIFTLGGGGGPGDFLSHVALPVFVMALNSIGVLVRYIRPSMLEVLGQDYLRTARAKGLKERVVVYKHALRNALNSVVTILGVQFAYEMGGSVVIEKIFSWPGLGRLTYDSVLTRDYPTVLGINLTMGGIVVIVNLLVDIIYRMIDPRIKSS